MNGSTRHTIHLQTTNDGGSCATTADRQKWPHVPWSPQSVNSMDWCKAKAYRETLDFIGKSMVSEFPVKNFDPETSPGWSKPAGSSQRTKFGAGLFDPRVGYCNWSWLLSDTTPRILVDPTPCPQCRGAAPPFLSPSLWSSSQFQRHTRCQSFRSRTSTHLGVLETQFTTLGWGSNGIPQQKNGELYGL